jgi:segregation and condensation protein B
MDAKIEEKQPRSIGEIISIVEALIFVAGEPLTIKTLAEVLTEDKETVEAAVEELVQEYEQRESGLQIREIAGGWPLLKSKLNCSVGCSIF